MQNVEYEVPPEERSSELRAFFADHPLAYAGYRISFLFRHDGTISESDEIPFVTSVMFPIIVAGYLILARIRILPVLLGLRPELPVAEADGHVFSMTSTHKYRTYTFREVGRALRVRGEQVLFLCSPATAEEQETWEAEGFSTVSHRELHAYVGIRRTVQGIIYAGVLTVRLRHFDDVDPSLRRSVLYYNFVLLEYVKRESVRPMTRENPSVHTFSGMPYLVDSTDEERVFVYQHGVQQAHQTGGKIMSAPFFAPITYLLWGEPWCDHYAPYIHSRANLRVVGSPWYEYLADRGEQARDPAHDVLFVSGSHGLTNEESEAAFESLVRNTIETCEELGFSLAVKLHPLESATWYEKRGWAEYVTDFEDIDEALLESRVSVTNASSAFVESAALAVPAIVADLWQDGLSDLAPVDYVRFTEGPEVGAAIKAALDGDCFRSAESSQLVLLENTTEEILEVIDEKRG